MFLGTHAPCSCASSSHLVMSFFIIRGQWRPSCSYVLHQPHSGIGVHFASTNKPLVGSRRKGRTLILDFLSSSRAPIPRISSRSNPDGRVAGDNPGKCGRKLGSAGQALTAVGDELSTLLSRSAALQILASMLVEPSVSSPSSRTLPWRLSLTLAWRRRSVLRIRLSPNGVPVAATGLPLGS